MVERAYAINGEGIAHEMLMGEAILINFKTGSYYSLDGTGGIIWECLCAGPASPSTLMAALGAGTSASESLALHEALERFLKELADEELLAVTDAAPLPLPVRAAAAGTSFEPPILQKYTDLEALLLLDPIHDVVVSGWPNAKQDPS